MRSRVISAFSVGANLAPEAAGLDLTAFSRFKHGAVAPAWRFAGQLAARLAAEADATLLAERLVVTASCYRYVPLASVTLARCLAHQLNRVRAAAGVPPVAQTQLYRDRLIEGDYSTMSMDSRRRFIEQDVIAVDVEALAGAAVLVVDDVRITGFHEGRIAALLEAAGVPETVFGYWAVIDGRTDPTLEKRLNEWAVGDLASLERLIASGRFVLNSRVCKLILGAGPDRLVDFLPRLPRPVLTEFVTGMECNGYAVMARYRPAYELALSVLDGREAQ